MNRTPRGSQAAFGSMRRRFRAISLVLVWMFTPSVWAADREISLDPNPSTSFSQAQDPTTVPVWEDDYHRGLKTAHLGTAIGRFGAIGIGAGVVVVAVSFASGASFEAGEKAWGPITGTVVAIGGLTAVQVGAPMAALGTTRAHRALVNGGRIQRGCGNCIASFVLSIPNPFFFLSLPSAYTVSAMQRHEDRVRYNRYKGFSSPKVGVTPRGVGLSWWF